MRPSSRQELKEFCLRALGAPVLEINVEDDQLEDRIDDALQFYQEYHSDAVSRTYVKHKITQSDIDNQFITLPEALLFVNRVLPISSGYSSSGLFSVPYQIALNDIYGLRDPGNLINYVMTRQHLSLLDMQLNGLTQTIRFNRHTNRLHIEAQWGDRIKLDDYIVMEGYIVSDPDIFTDIYNDMFLKKYTTALFKRQWGLNLIKFAGLTLPGGVTLNGETILSAAETEIEKLESEMELKFSTPIDFFVG